MTVPARIAALVLVLVLSAAGVAAAQTALSGGRLRVTHIDRRIAIDGDLSDEAWQTIDRVDRWFETSPGDNVEPRVKSVGRLAYDDRFFYAGFEFDDPAPAAIRAPLADHDNISGNSTDYAGVILDTRNDGHSAVLLLATPRGVQYDAQTDDAAGEDSSPDFFWDAAARINEHGWTLEIRVPFSSLRYRSADPQTWGILLYRNYPRDFRYQIFSAQLPRGGNCFICRANTLVGLERLPGGGHVVAAPYMSAARTAEPVGDLGTPLKGGDVKPRGGIDVKWTPNAENVVDFTIKPDFSQIESDTAQIATNERFALLYNEKRPFFLEGVTLLKTPIQAVYTRTITSPKWGSRITGKSHGIGYTALIAEDQGGGQVVVPGPNSSSLVDQEFGSYVMLARAKREVGRSFVSVLATDRESHDGQGYNRLFGPDFQWRWQQEVLTGQWLVSSSRTPNRPDLDESWQGNTLSGKGATLDWSHSTTRFDVNGGYKDFDDGFRAEAGFVPQVGYRNVYGNSGWTFRPRGFLRRLRTYVNTGRQVDQSGVLVSENVTPAVGMDAKWNGFMQFRFINDRTRSGEQAFTRRQFGYIARFSPSRRVTQLGVEGVAGQEIDFSNSRLGRGATVNVNAQIVPTDHLELSIVQNQRWLDVTLSPDPRARLFIARVSRVRATYMFTANFFARVIGQYVWTSRNPALYIDEVDARSGDLNASALIAYKINWQSVLFAGYGDARELSDRQQMEPSSRQFFVKVSYAVQR